jgi:hypothetical protein
MKIIKVTESQPPYHFQCRTITAPIDPAWLSEEDLKWMNEETKRAKETGEGTLNRSLFEQMNKVKKPDFLTPDKFMKTVEPYKPTQAEKMAIAKTPQPKIEPQKPKWANNKFSSDYDPLNIESVTPSRQGQAIAKTLGVPKKEAQAYINSIREFTGNYSYREIRKSQKEGNPNADAVNIEKFLNNPNVPKYDGAIYRGIVGSVGSRAESVQKLTQMVDQMSVGGEIQLAAMASHSINMDVAKVFSDGIVYKINENKSGVSISPMSAVPEEAEILVPSGTKYRIVKIRIPPEGVISKDRPAIIELEEI